MGDKPNSIRNHADYKRNRAALLKDNPVCVLCGLNAATEADHILEIDAGGTNAMENLQPVCKPCNARKGQAYRVRKERDQHGAIIGGQTPRTVNVVDDKSFYGGGQMTPHLLKRVSHKDLPELALTGHDLPRLETPTHSGAVSAATDIGDFAQAVLGVTLEPWQLHAVAGMTQQLGGQWVCRQSLVSVARQNGKTTLMSALIGWWLSTQGSARGRPQVVLSTAHKLDLAASLFKYLAPILEAKLGAQVSRSYGRQELVMPDGSTWIVRAATPQAGHGYSIDLCVVDEAWAVSEECVDEGFAPAQIARPNPLLALFSTAGTTESKLMLKWREQGLRQMDQGDAGPLYFASWEPPPGLDPMTPEAWAYANPAMGRHITLDTLHDRSKSPNRNAFLRGHVNLFTVQSNAWLEAGLWSELADPSEIPPGGVLAIDASSDESRFMGVRCVKDGEGRLRVTVEFNVDTQAQMWAAVHECVEECPQIRLAIVPSLELHCPPVFERRRTIVGYRELLKWTLAVRSLITDGKVSHTGQASLAEHVERAVMVKHQGSIALSSTKSPGDITMARCMIWAVALESRPGAAGKPMLAVAR
jgi:hypothetical protein